MRMDTTLENIVAVTLPELSNFIILLASFIGITIAGISEKLDCKKD